MDTQFTSDHAQELMTEHKKIRTQYEALKKANGVAEFVLEQFDELADLGDTVTPENVIDAASKCVAKGADAMAFAQALGTMPEQPGPPLEAWIQQEGQKFELMAQQLEQLLEAKKHELGVNSIHLLAGHDAQPGPSAQPSSNPLY